MNHPVVYCRCREAVKLFRSLLSPHSLKCCCTVTYINHEIFRRLQLYFPTESVIKFYLLIDLPNCAGT
jgi:hypothetical protein